MWNIHQSIATKAGRYGQEHSHTHLSWLLPVSQHPGKLLWSSQSQLKQSHPRDTPGSLTLQTHAAWLSKPSCLWGAIKHSCSGDDSKSRGKHRHYLDFKSTWYCFETAILMVDLLSISEDFYSCVCSLNRHSCRSQSWVQLPARLWNLSSCIDVSKREGQGQLPWAKHSS